MILLNNNKNKKKDASSGFPIDRFPHKHTHTYIHISRSHVMCVSLYHRPYAFILLSTNHKCFVDIVVVVILLFFRCDFVS